MVDLNFALTDPGEFWAVWDVGDDDHIARLQHIVLLVEEESSSRA
jgi:hypothetical protein